MDISKQYIEMCDCPETQGAHSEAEGNLYAARNYIVVSSLRMVWDAAHMERFIWLPRQDQWQEMVHKLREDKKQFSGNHGLLRRFAAWVDEDSNLPCASMEQLWLAFVMKEKYDKVWDGKWVDRV